MEIRKFNLLIGEQATGKSTIAKSVYYFKSIKTKIIDYLTQICDSNSYNNVLQKNTWFDKALKAELKNIFIKLFGYSWDLHPEFYMKYNYTEELWIQVKLKKEDKNRQYISITYASKLLNSLKRIQEDVREIHRNSIGGAVRTSLLLTNEERKRHHEMIQVDGGLITGLSEGDSICDNLIYTIEDRSTGLNIKQLCKKLGAISGKRKEVKNMSMLFSL